MSSVISLQESIRSRPGMFIGNLDYQGISYLINNVLLECIGCSQKHGILFLFSIENNLSLTIQIETNENADSILSIVEANDHCKNGMYLQVLRMLSKSLIVSSNARSISFEIGKYVHSDSEKKGGAKGIRLNIVLDNDIFKEASINYEHLTEKLSQVAMLNPGNEIVVKDVRPKYIRQEYYCYPEGVKYLFDKLCKEQRSYFDLYNEQMIGVNKYNVGISFTHLWANEPIIISFADDHKTIEHGSLVEGVLSGIIQASKKFVGAQDAHEYDFSKSRLKRYKNLVLIANVKGDGNGFNYYGSTYYKLDEPQVRKEAEKYTSELCQEYMCNYPEKAKDTIKWIFWKLW